MRIVMVTNQLPPKVIGGLAYSVIRLASTLRKRGHEVHILSGDSRSRFVRTIEANVRPFGRSRRLLARSDIVHVHGPHGTLYSSYKRKLIVTVHSTILRELPFEPSPDYLLALIPELLTLKACRIVVIPSRAITKELISFYGIRERKIRIIPNGIDLQPSSQYVSKRDSSQFVRILAVGRLVKRKGFDVLIRAMRQVVDRHPTTTLTLIGEGKLRSTIARQIESLRLERNVDFRGFLSREDLLKTYCNADVFVCPSLYESFGMVLLDALNSGLAIVASGIYPLRDLVRNYENGYVFKAGDASELAEKIGLLIENPALREKLGKGSRQIAEKLPTWDEVARMYEKLYSSL